MAICKMSLEKIGNTLVAYCTEGSITDDDVERLISAAKQPGVEQLFCFMEGNVQMTPLQRDRSRSQLITFKTIGITDNAFVRGIGQMIRWFGGKIDMYSREKYNEAARELKMGAIETSKVILFIDRTRRANGIAVAS